MNRNQLYQAIGQADDAFLEQSERSKTARRKGFYWPTAVAALLAIALVGGVVLRTVGPLYAQGSVSPQPTDLSPEQIAKAVHTLAQPKYPAMAQYPDESAPDFETQYQEWEKSLRAQRQEPGYADGLEPFFTASSAQFLANSAGKNQVFAPLNVYLALGMLSEIADGSSRQQILDLLGEENIEALRQQAQAVWNAHYREDGAVTSLLANSMWLNDSLDFVPETMQNLSDWYYASAYQGKMGTPEMNTALQNWLDEQTGGLLKGEINQLETNPNAAMLLASSVSFRAKWDVEFDPERTVEGDFHSRKKTISCDFMHSSDMQFYYQTKRFSAVQLRLADGAGNMWLMLPHEDSSVDEVLQDPATMAFLLNGGNRDSYQYLTVNLALPKFDFTSQIDLAEGLQALGVRDVFDPVRANFSPMLQEEQKLCVSKAQHDVRAAIDEEGITAAAYTAMMMETAAMPTEEVDFVLDRPFLFAVTSEDDLPLFMGRVEQPNA